MINDIDTDIDNLLNEVEAVKRIEGKGAKKQFQKGGVVWPDALVLLQREITCKCGSTYHSPNPTLLLRFGEHRKAPKEWLPRFNNLPREIYHIKEEAQACDDCFADVYIQMGEI